MAINFQKVQILISGFWTSVDESDDVMRFITEEKAIITE